MNKPIIIAEVGCNHKGDMNIAKEMISVAAIYSKVDVVKFQKRNNKELLTPEQYNTPHPNPRNSYGKTYGEHREKLEFTQDQHRLLKKWCEDVGVIYSTSVWDLTSAKEIVELNPKLIKIPSACNNNFEMLDYLCRNYSGEIHCSLGMTSHREINFLVGWIKESKKNQNFVFYSCTSGYPVPFKDVCLLEIPRLIRKYGKNILGVGFSGHHLGIAIDNAAVALGAEWVERHFTLDRTWKGTDHAASLEPDGMRKLVRDLNATWESLTKKKGILEIEKEQRKKLKWKK